MSTEIFEKWIEKVFIPAIQQRRRADKFKFRKALLITDGHSSRKSPKAIDMLIRARIDQLVIPAHSSHLLQPLDCGVFRAFKAGMSGKTSVLSRTPKDNKRTVLLAIISKEFHIATFDKTVKDSWAASGLFPPNRNIVLGSEKLRKVPLSEPAHSDQSKKKRSFVNISGTVLTSKEIKQALIEEKRKKEEKKIKKPKKSHK